MAKKDHRRDDFLEPMRQNQPGSASQKTPPPKSVESLLDSMKDGAEYVSLVNVVTRPDHDVIDDVAKAIEDIQAVRGRPCISYIGNVVKQVSPDAGIVADDDTPFAEMVNQVPRGENSVDVLLATPGGSAQQVGRFVNCLRNRFANVEFLLPSFCMSAGTLFALSGNEIWMSENACLGPIDPQFPNREGRYVPAQALLLLVQSLQQAGDDARAQGKPIPWTAIRLIDQLDMKELASAYTASDYSIKMAIDYLVQYKFASWQTRETAGIPVTPQYRAQRAQEIATELGMHDRWKSHGHSISRDVLWKEIKLKIKHPNAELERRLRRFWAICHWLFDHSAIYKIQVSSQYRLIRHLQIVEFKK